MSTSSSLFSISLPRVMLYRMVFSKISGICGIRVTRDARVLMFHVHDLNMVPRRTVYYQFGRGRKRVLRFTKSGIKRIEEAYSKSYVWNQSQEKEQQVVGRAMTGQEVRRVKG